MRIYAHKTVDFIVKNMLLKKVLFVKEKYLTIGHLFSKMFKVIVK